MAGTLREPARVTARRGAGDADGWSGTGGNANLFASSLHGAEREVCALKAAPPASRYSRRPARETAPQGASQADSGRWEDRWRVRPTRRIRPARQLSTGKRAAGSQRRQGHRRSEGDGARPASGVTSVDNRRRRTENDQAGGAPACFCWRQGANHESRITELESRGWLGVESGEREDCGDWGERDSG